MKKQFTLFRMVFLLCAMIIGGVSPALAADEPDVTYDFTGSDWTVSNGVLSNGTVSFSGQGGNSFKMNSGYFIMGKSSAYINFPTYSSPVSKIVVTGRSGASADVKQNIFVGETAVSTETKGATGANTYEIASGQQAAGTQYTLKVTSNHNTQITKIEVYFGSSSDPSISANDAAVSWDAEGGNIEYTISNPVEGGFVMATEWDTEATWLQFSGNGSGNKLPFTVSTNYGGERSANVTLKYTYVIDEKVYDASTTVTVTQGAKPAPVIIVDPDSYTIGKDETSIEIPYTIQYPNPNTNPALAFEGNTEWTTLGREFDYDNKKVTITTDANNTPERTVNVVFKYDGAEDKTVTLTQEGVKWPTVSFRANPAEGADGFLCINTSDNSKQLTSGDMVKPGDWIAISVTPAGNYYEFANWTEANNKLEIANPTETTISFQMPEENVEIVANFNVPSIEWVKTSISDLTANDVFVIVGDNGNTYAMANDSGTSDAPSAVAVTVDNGKLTGPVADNIQWNISGNATDGYTFYPNGDTETWLYCTNNNNGVRVGTNDSKTFVIDQNYLKHSGTSRYVGIYNSQDWRCYTSINANIKDQTFAFYKKVSTAPDERAEAGLAFNESSYSVELVNAASFTSPVLSNPNELSPITWTSSNETVATVNEGTVTILSEGETTIKASFDGDENYKKGEASYTLTVQDSRTALELSFDPESVEVNVNATVAIPTLNGNQGNGTVTYASDDETIATVTEDANTSLVVTGLAEGTTTITATVAATNEYKEGTATFTVTVIDPNKKGSVNNPYTVDEARAAIDAGTGITGVYATGIVSEIVTAFNSQYGNITYNISADGLTTSDQLQAYRGKSYNGNNFTSADDIKVGDVVVIYGDLKKHGSTYEFGEGNQLVSLERPSVPAIIVADPTINVNASSQSITRGITVNNLTISGADNFHIKYYNANDEEVEKPSWIEEATVTMENSAYVLSCTVAANEGDERTTYLKVYAMNGDETIYSNLVTITQAKYVPDYATLPFEFNDGRADIEETDGLTQEGLGSDYNANNNPTTKLKFDSTGDWMILKINEIPGTLTFDIKGNGFSGGTFTVQTSADGVTYTDLQTYTDLTATTQSEEFDIAANVRYIKWIYTEKSSGNIGLGNITLDNTSMAVTIAAACNDGKNTPTYYGTFSSSSAFVVPENLTVSEIGIDNDGKMDVRNYESGAVVPANTGVMVSATTPGNFKLIKSSAEGKSVLGAENRLRPTGDNALTATEMNSAEPETCKFYRLTMHGAAENNPGKIGFWWGADGGQSFDIVANKAYLAVPASVAGTRNGFAFGDDATGINNVNVNENVNGSVFDLQGRKVSTPGKGLYIVNGKKVVIK